MLHPGHGHSLLGLGEPRAEGVQREEGSETSVPADIQKRGSVLPSSFPALAPSR